MRFLAPVMNRYLATGVQFLITALITNALPLRDAGVYFELFGVVTTTYVIAGLGAPDGLVKLYPALAGRGRTSECDRLQADGLTFAVLASLPLAAFVGVAMGLVTSSTWTGILAALWWLAYGVTYIAAQGLVSDGRAALGTALYYGAANWFVVLLVTPYVLVDRDPSLTGVLTCTVVGSALSAVASGGLLIRHSRPQLRLRGASVPWELLRAGVPIAAGRAVQSLLIWSPVWLAGALIGPAAAAVVALASRIAAAVGAAIASIRFSVRPTIVRDAALHRWSNIAALGSTIATWMTGLALLALVGDLLVGQWVIPRVFGSGYQHSHVVVAVLLVATVAEACAGSADEVLKMTSPGSTVLSIQVGALALSVVAQVAGEAWWGVYGLAAGFATGFSAMYVAIVWTLWDRRGILILPRMRQPVFTRS